MAYKVCHKSCLLWRKLLGWLGVWGVYVLIDLIVLLPLLSSGYILTLDMVFSPRIRWPDSVASSSYLFYVLLHLLNFVLASDVLEKIILLVVLLFCGVGMHKLVQYFSAKRSNVYDKIGEYFAGTLYAINPFTYDRFMSGQYEVLLGYALLPWFIRALLQFLQYPSLGRIIILTIWAIVISIVSIHTIGFMAILTLMALILRAWQNRNNHNWLISMTRYSLLALSIFIVASSYWLIPLALGHDSTATTIDSFNATDQAAFSTLGGSVLGRTSNVLKLQGFWAENRGLYTLPQANIATWGLITVVTWLLIIIGIVSLWRNRQRSIVALFGLSAIIATTLAIGTLNNWLAAHVPLFAGYREPEKFVGLIALSYAIFAGYGVGVILKFCHGQGGKFFLILGSIVLLSVPLIWTSTMLWGFNNQLTPVQYPADWFTMNNRLDADHSNFQVLFLPWHEYMSFNFAGRIIANPAPRFFDKPVIISNNPQFKGIGPGVSNPEDTDISTILAAANEHQNIGAQLARYHVKYVLLALDDDYTKYAYLNHQTDLQLVTKGATLELYRNKAFKE
jgi:hypothetical protein